MNDSCENRSHLRRGRENLLAGFSAETSPILVESWMPFLLSIFAKYLWNHLSTTGWGIFTCGLPTRSWPSGPSFPRLSWLHVDVDAVAVVAAGITSPALPPAPWGRRWCSCRSGRPGRRTRGTTPSGSGRRRSWTAARGGSPAARSCCTWASRESLWHLSCCHGMRDT